MASLQDRRVWLGGGAAAAVVIAAASWLLVISPELSSASSLRAQVSDASLQNAITQSKVAKLRQQVDNLGSLTASLNAALEALPTTSGLPAFTRQLSAQAAASHVRVSSIAIAGITAVTSTAAAAPVTPAVAGTPAVGAAPAVAGTPAPATGGIYAIPVTVASNGSFAHELAFLKAIQTVGPRRALVTSTQLAAGSGAQAASVDGSATVTTQLTVFSAPLSPPQAAALQKLLSGDLSN